MHYKDYSIEAFETSGGRWRARIRRLDGKQSKYSYTATKPSPL